MLGLSRGLFLVWMIIISINLFVSIILIDGDLIMVIFIRQKIVFMSLYWFGSSFMSLFDLGQYSKINLSRY